MKPAFDATSTTAAAGLGLSLSASSLWLWPMRGPPLIAAAGRLCGHAPAQLHCAACAASLGAAALGLVIAVSALARTPSPARA
jgi:hypothetical protein